jgi:hypothetical protein
MPALVAGIHVFFASCGRNPRFAGDNLRARTQIAAYGKKLPAAVPKWPGRARAAQQLKRNT